MHSPNGTLQSWPEVLRLTKSGAPSISTAYTWTHYEIPFRGLFSYVNPPAIADLRPLALPTSEASDCMSLVNR